MYHNLAQLSIMQDLVPWGELKKNLIVGLIALYLLPGLLLLQDHPEVFWSVLFSMYLEKH